MSNFFFVLKAKDTRNLDALKEFESFREGFGADYLSTGEDGKNQVKAPQHLVRYIDTAWELWRETEARRCMTRWLSEIELACLIGITEGFARATGLEEPTE